MTFNIWTFLFEIVNFVVLAMILHWLFYRPLRAAIERRKAENARARDEAEAARRDAEQLQSQLQIELNAIDDKRREILSQATARAEDERQQTLAAVKQSAEELLAQHQKHLEQLRADALKQLESEVSELSIELTSRLLTSIGSTTLNTQLVEHLMNKLGELSPQQLDELRSRTEHPRIDFAGDLPENLRQRLNDRVSEVLGRSVEVVYESNPALIHGVLLRIGGRVWDASLAGQLDQIRKRPTLGVK